MPTINIEFEQLTRDLAGQYAQGLLSIDEYLTLWREMTLTHVGNTEGGVTV